MSDTIDTIQRIEQDFAENNAPFDDVEFPEERLLDEMLVESAESKLQVISLFATLDYNRDANQLVDKILELRDSNLLDPHFVVEKEEYVRSSFDEVAFRYKSRDADAWIKNCRILCEEYHGRWTELLLETGCDAPSLVEQLNDDDFNCLKGVKIAPMYARIINDDVCNLRRLWELDIPVDTHIRRLSKELFGDEYDDDEIRELWYMHGVSNDIDRHVVDGALWHIGNQWDNWGEDYWNEVTA